MAIFQTSGQAVHFSYVVQAYDASPQSQMAMIMRAAIKELGARSSSIDFDGLTPLEVRGQCAMIRACVRTHLRPMEASAIEARYSRDRDTKRVAIRALADYYGPVIGVNASVALALLWRQHVDKKQKKDFTLRQIAKGYAIPFSSAQRAALALNDHLHAMEGLALSNLHERFVASGVIDANTYAHG